MLDSRSGFPVADARVLVTGMAREERWEGTTNALGQVVIAEGDAGASLYVVVSGELSVHRNGNEIARLGAGSPFGERALLNKRRRSATVVAQTEVRLLVQERQEFIKLADECLARVASALEDFDPDEVDFEEADGGTNLTLRHVRFPSEESRANHEGGWGRILDTLAGQV